MVKLVCHNDIFFFQIPDGTDSEGRTKYKTISVLITFQRGILRVKGEKKHKMSAGFKVTIEYNDGKKNGFFGGGGEFMVIVPIYIYILGVYLMTFLFKIFHSLFFFF